MALEKPPRLSALVFLLALTMSFAPPVSAQQPEPVEEPVELNNNHEPQGQADQDGQKAEQQEEIPLAEPSPSQVPPVILGGIEAVIGVPEKPVNDLDSENPEQQRDEKDDAKLCTRTQMWNLSLPLDAITACSTYYMAILSGLGLFVSSIGVWYLVKTFKVTAKAAEAAMLSAKAAEQVVKQDRAEVAFVASTHQELGRAETGNHIEGVLRLQWTVKNYGKTPAFRVSVNTSIEQVDPFNPATETVPHTAEPVFERYYENLIPDAKEKAVQVDVALADILSACHSSKAVLVRLRMTFVDKYADHRYTETACQIRPRLGPNGIYELSIPRLEYVVDMRLGGADVAT